MNRLFILALRVLLVLLFFGALSVQLWYLPWTARDFARQLPIVDYLATPYLTLCIAAVACIQVAFVALWVLLGKVRRGRIFSDSSFGWVNTIIVAGVTATAIIAAIEFHVLVFVNEGGPALVVLLTALVVAGSAFVLVMLVMRGLLRQATALQSELDEVV